MKKPSVAELIYQKAFPKPKQTDPGSFFAHVQRHIVGEVRVEVQTYYGALDTLEAQYPGLDYTYGPHRRRMSRYPWHRRLFRAFDELGLTNDEILNLCQWEGTRAAKEKYEREAETEVKTTTGDDIEAAPRGRPRAIIEDWSRPSSANDVPGAPSLPSGDRSTGDAQQPERRPSPNRPHDLIERIGVALRGDLSSVHPLWQQWLREALGRQEMNIDSLFAHLQEPRPAEGLNAAASPSSSIRANDGESSTSLPAPGQHSTFDELHALVDDLQTTNSQLAVDNAALAMAVRSSPTEAAR